MKKVRRRYRYRDRAAAEEAAQDAAHRAYILEQFVLAEAADIRRFGAVDAVLYATAPDNAVNGYAVLVELLPEGRRRISHVGELPTVCNELRRTGSRAAKLAAADATDWARQARLQMRRAEMEA